MAVTIWTPTRQSARSWTSSGACFGRACVGSEAGGSRARRERALARGRLKNHPSAAQPSTHPNPQLQPSTLPQGAPRPRLQDAAGGAA